MDLHPKGLFEPILCKKIMCNIIRPNTRKGIIKWRQKKRLTVIVLTLLEPQIILTISPPKTGTSLNKLVITDAPQYDIWFIGKT